MSEKRKNGRIHWKPIFNGVAIVFIVIAVIAGIAFLIYTGNRIYHEQWGELCNPYLESPLRDVPQKCIEYFGR